MRSVIKGLFIFDDQKKNAIISKSLETEEGRKKLAEAMVEPIRINTFYTPPRTILKKIITK